MNIKKIFFPHSNLHFQMFNSFPWYNEAFLFRLPQSLLLYVGEKHIVVSAPLLGETPMVSEIITFLGSREMLPGIATISQTLP